MRAAANCRGAAISLYAFLLVVGASLGPLLAYIIAMFTSPLALTILAVVAGLPALATCFMENEIDEPAF
ncbi:MAG: hypothetical protein V6Z86_09145 [Hyphomicrobiales bacterium]